MSDEMILRLSFEPEAIREHFSDNERVQSMSDDDLASVGDSCIGDDRLYRLFDTLLRENIEDQFGFDPDAEEETA